MHIPNKMHWHALLLVIVGMYLVCITRSLKTKRVFSSTILVNLIVIFHRGGLGPKFGSVSQKAMEIYCKGRPDVLVNISETTHSILQTMVLFNAKSDGPCAHAKSVVVSQKVRELHRKSIFRPGFLKVISTSTGPILMKIAPFDAEVKLDQTIF